MIRISWMLVSYLAAVIVILAGADPPERVIDTGRSSLRVHVGKAGLLSAAAHEHWVNAPIAGGTVDTDGARPAEWFTVDVRGLSARPEKGSLTKNAPRCNPTCRARCWNQPNYPDIVLRIDAGPVNRRPVWRVAGDLPLQRSTSVARHSESLLSISKKTLLRASLASRLRPPRAYFHFGESKVTLVLLADGRYFSRSSSELSLESALFPALGRAQWLCVVPQ